MRIVQILPAIAFGDAIGNHVMALDRMFSAKGYQSKIYADIIDSRLPTGTASVTGRYREKKGDIILYHMSTGSDLNRKITEYKAPKILNYHNITPADYFEKYNKEACACCGAAREDLLFLADKADGCIADSAYNRRELRESGYQCPVKVVPVLIPFRDYEKKPDRNVLRDYGDGYTNILFVGRIVPNKKQESLIEAFYYYKKYFNPKARLILAGTYAGIDRYAEELKWYAGWLKLKDVIFTGQIRFEELLALYQRADLFLCMSEHEGFCVPLIEAMYFGVPVIALDRAAVAETMGGAGIVLKENNSLETAGMMHYLMTHTGLRDRIRREQRERLKDFEHKKISDAYVKFLRHFETRRRCR